MVAMGRKKRNNQRQSNADAFSKLFNAVSRHEQLRKEVAGTVEITLQEASVKCPACLADVIDLLLKRRAKVGSVDHGWKEE